MCGILGLAPADPRALAGLLPAAQAMRDAMAHRGPDAAGLWHDDHVILAHRRLSVIDVAGGAQPMTGADGSVITFNGEIYNFGQLRDELIAKGHVFTTNSDTEVLLAGYAQWGQGVLDRLNGMFAFAIWDPARRQVFLARDRMGEKPLYWHLGEAGLVFASEMKAILGLPGMSAIAEMDMEALSDFLSLGYILTPKTIIRQIRRLPAGHCATYDLASGKLDIRAYWSLAPHVTAEKQPYDKAARRQFRDLLDEAVSMRMRSDVPLGAFLSGGLDSSSIVEAMARMSTGDVRAFCVGFAAASFDESAGARRTSESLGVHLDVLPFEESEPDLAQLVWQCDEPFADTSLVPTAVLCRAARQGLTVALSGDGADEILAGYPTYAADRHYRLYRPVPAPVQAGLSWLAGKVLRPSYRKVSLDYKIRRFLGAGGLSPQQAHYWWRVVFPEGDKARLLKPEIRRSLGNYTPYGAFRDHYNDVAGASFLDASLYVDCATWLQDDILVKVDRMSMAVGLEVRAPFLDHRLVEFCARLPEDAKQCGGEQKIALRRAVSGALPAGVLTKPKKGFNAPVLDLGALTLDGAHGHGHVFAADFTLDPRAEDITFKSFSLRVLQIWLRMFSHYKRTGQWIPTTQ